MLLRISSAVHASVTSVKLLRLTGASGHSPVANLASALTFCAPPARFKAAVWHCLPNAPSSRISTPPYFVLGAFLIFSCFGFLTFLPPLSLLAMVSLLLLLSG